MKNCAFLGLFLALNGWGWCQKVIPGCDAKKNAQKLVTQVSWSKSLEEAKSRAQQQGKLIFWMHMLGSLEGDT